MTASTSTTHTAETTDRQDDSTATAAAASCPACPHPLAEHDPIGSRFCRATTAGGFDRGCICRH
jgi:hypothetical protein